MQAKVKKRSLLRLTQRLAMSEDPAQRLFFSHWNVGMCEWAALGRLRKHLFVWHFLSKQLPFCQDRLGTNIREVEVKVFLCRLSAAETAEQQQLALRA